MNFSRLQPTYISIGYCNNETVDTMMPAIADQNFGTPIFKDLSKYICAIERLELSLNGIPYFDGIALDRLEYIDLFHPASGNTTRTLIQIIVYSLPELLSNLTNTIYANPNAGDIAGNPFISFIFTCIPDGKIQVTCTTAGYNFGIIKMQISNRLNSILGISETLQFAGILVTQSVHSRLDLGDELNHIMIRSFLPTKTDTIGIAQEFQLTDISPFSDFSNSYSYIPGAGRLDGTNTSFNIRQKLIYVPNERRYLDLTAAVHLSTLRLEALYVNNYNVTYPVMLPFGGVFQIKLGFYAKQ